MWMLERDSKTGKERGLWDSWDREKQKVWHIITFLMQTQKWRRHDCCWTIVLKEMPLNELPRYRGNPSYWWWEVTKELIMILSPSLLTCPPPVHANKALREEFWKVFVGDLFMLLLAGIKLYFWWLAPSSLTFWVCFLLRWVMINSWRLQCAAQTTTWTLHWDSVSRQLPSAYKEKQKQDFTHYCRWLETTVEGCFFLATFFCFSVFCIFVWRTVHAEK